MTPLFVNQVARELSHADPHHQAGPVQEPAGGAPRILWSDETAEAPRPLLQPDFSAAGQLLPAQEPQVVGLEREPSGSGTPAGGWPLHHRLRLLRLRKKGKTLKHKYVIVIFVIISILWNIFKALPKPFRWNNEES